MPSAIIQGHYEHAGNYEWITIWKKSELCYSFIVSIIF